MSDLSSIIDRIINEYSSLVLIEGCDCSGKTIFARALVNRLMAIGVDSHYVHAVDGYRLEDYLKWFRLLDREVSSFGDRRFCLVADRCWISDLAYSMALRRKRDLMDGQAGYLDGLASAYRPIYVLMDPGIDVILERYHTRGDDDMSFRDIRKVWKYYRRYASCSDLFQVIKG